MFGSTTMGIMSIPIGSTDNFKDERKFLTNKTGIKFGDRCFCFGPLNDYNINKLPDDLTPQEAIWLIEMWSIYLISDLEYVGSDDDYGCHESEWSYFDWGLSDDEDEPKTFQTSFEDHWKI